MEKVTIMSLRFLLRVLMRNVNEEERVLWNIDLDTVSEVWRRQEAPVVLLCSWLSHYCTAADLITQGQQGAPV